MRLFLGALFSCVSWVAIMQPAHADDAMALAQKFGAMQTIDTISLSPDASKVAFTTVTEAGTTMLVADLAAGGVPRSVLTIRREDGAIDWCQWSAPERIICRARYASEFQSGWITSTRMFAVNSDGHNLVKLSVEANFYSHDYLQNGGQMLALSVPDHPGTILMTRTYVPDDHTGTRLGSTSKGLGVDAIDTVTLHRSPIEGPRADAVEYHADGAGTVRIMGLQGSDHDGYLKDQVHYLYRKTGSRSWESLSTVTSGSKADFDPYEIDGDSVLGFQSLNGRNALYRVALDGSARKDLVLARPDVDVDGLIRIGRANRVVGVSYVTDRRVIEYSDPELRKLSANFARVLPGQPQVEIVDASEGEKQLLLIASGDTHPGMVYLYDKASHKLRELLSVRSELDGMDLAPMKQVTYTAADGTAIPAYLTLPPGSNGKGLPAIVMPHGGPDSRDEWGFDWLVQFYAMRGFAVLQPNYRGSSGYGAAWFGQNGFHSWRAAMGDVLDAGRWLEKQGIAAPGKLAIVGWSYGGYAALQTAVVDPNVFKAIVAIAPVTDLNKLETETENFTNHRLVEAQVGTGDDLAAASPALHPGQIKAPVLLFHGDRDQNVGVRESRAMAAQLRAAGKSVEYTEFPGLDHQLESAEARTRLLSTSDAFLRKSLGM
jgi:dipeptidyl aminopeptidase/acylaminoacyl peptidase